LLPIVKPSARLYFLRVCAAREANATKKDDDRQFLPRISIIIYVDLRGKE
jgi:hypothetical protein